MAGRDRCSAAMRCRAGPVPRDGGLTRERAGTTAHGARPGTPPAPPGTYRSWQWVTPRFRVPSAREAGGAGHYVGVGMKSWIKWALIAAVFLASLAVPVTQAQTPPAINVYSIWLRMSLRGYSQEEIESALRNMDAKTLDEVKNRLRRTVLANLRLKKVRERFQASRDKGDLQDVISTVETEIRFSGLENDMELKHEIEEAFGIPVNRL